MRDAGDRIQPQTAGFVKRPWDRGGATAVLENPRTF
jgi:hypothetical protein